MFLFLFSILDSLDLQISLPRIFTMLCNSIASLTHKQLLTICTNVEFFLNKLLTSSTWETLNLLLSTFPTFTLSRYISCLESKERYLLHTLLSMTTYLGHEMLMLKTLETLFVLISLLCTWVTETLLWLTLKADILLLPKFLWARCTAGSIFNGFDLL